MKRIPVGDDVAVLVVKLELQWRVGRVDIDEEQRALRKECGECGVGAGDGGSLVELHVGPGDRRGLRSRRQLLHRVAVDRRDLDRAVLADTRHCHLVTPRHAGHAALMLHDDWDLPVSCRSMRCVVFLTDPKIQRRKESNKRFT